jgi:hypothetical protein
MQRDMTMFKSKNTLPPLRETEKKDPMLKTRFLPPAHFESRHQTPAAHPPFQALPVINGCRCISRCISRSRLRVRVRPVLSCQHPPVLSECAACVCVTSASTSTSASAGTAPLISLSIRFASLRSVLPHSWAHPGQKKPHQASPPPDAHPPLHFTLTFARTTHYHFPTPEKHKPCLSSAIDR